MRVADLAALQEAEAMLSDAARLYADAGHVDANEGAEAETAADEPEDGATDEEAALSDEAGEDAAPEQDASEQASGEEVATGEEAGEVDLAEAEEAEAATDETDTPDTEELDIADDAGEPDFVRLAEQRAAYAEEARQYIEARGGETDIDAGEAYRTAVNFAEGDSDGTIRIAEAVSGESYIVERLRSYLADEMISVETKTLFQLMLPEIRADRDYLAMLVGGEPSTRGVVIEEDMSDTDAEVPAPDDADEAASGEEDGDSDSVREEDDNNGIPVPSLKINLGA